MSSRNEETKALASAAFWRLLEAGKQPTIDLVNNLLEEEGHGKRWRNVISETIKECKAKARSKGESHSDSAEIPKEAVALMAAFQHSLQIHFRQQAELKYKAQIEALQEELAALKATPRKDAGGDRGGKPSRSDLLRAIAQLQNHIGIAKGAFLNDRGPNRAKAVMGELEAAFDLCVSTTAFDPPQRAR